MYKIGRKQKMEDPKLDGVRWIGNDTHCNACGILGGKTKDFRELCRWQNSLWDFFFVLENLSATWKNGLATFCLSLFFFKLQTNFIDAAAYSYQICSSQKRKRNFSPLIKCAMRSMHSLSLMWIVLLVVCFASMELICFPKKRTICQTNLSYIHMCNIWQKIILFLFCLRFQYGTMNKWTCLIVLFSIIQTEFWKKWCYENIECVHWKSHTKQIAVCCAMKSVIAFVAHWMVLFCFVKCDISKIIKDHHEHITQTVERPTMALKERRGTEERRGKKIGCQ